MSEKQITLSDDQREEVVQMVATILGSGGTIGMSRGFTADEVEVAHSVAASLYEQKKYDKAMDAFKFLCFNEHMDARAWMGFGACCQVLGDYERAIQAYACVAVLDINNIKAPFYSAECYAALRNWEMADKALEAVNYWLDQGWQSNSRISQSEFASFREKTKVLERHIENHGNGVEQA